MERVRRSPLRAEVRWEGVVAIVMVAGELDLTTAPGVCECLLEVAGCHPGRVVLDLGRLVFVDVAGARALDGAYKALAAQCPVILCRPRPSARKVFQLTGLMGG